MPTIRFLPESPVFGSPPPIASGTTGNDSNDSDAELLVQHDFPDRKAKAKFGCPGKFTSIEMVMSERNGGLGCRSKA
ncbi:hypothetical protein GPALN_012191 [Globodera pallida]|nr:hypothetical protein GPALN_012191 [Globodera pallida]